MNIVFADAGYWIALFDPRDQLHLKAIAASRSTEGCRVVTSLGVLTEFLNHFASFGSQFRRKAAQVVISIQQNPQVEIVPQTAEQFTGALNLYLQRPDKEWGMTDCTSFMIMQQQGIAQVLVMMNISGKQASYYYCGKINTESRSNERDSTVKMDRRAFFVISLSDEPDDKVYWLSKAPQERLQTIEILRQLNYSYDPTTARIQRILEVDELQKR